jgi:hypothetical protein
MAAHLVVHWKEEVAVLLLAVAAYFKETPKISRTTIQDQAVILVKVIQHAITVLNGPPVCPGYIIYPCVMVVPLMIPS